MHRKNRKAPNTIGPEEHFESLGELMAQLKAHLTTSAEKKGTYGDYLRLLEFYRQTRGVHAREILVGWIENEKPVTEPVGMAD